MGLFMLETIFDVIITTLETAWLIMIVVIGNVVYNKFWNYKEKK